jgi:hypothetical protein
MLQPGGTHGRAFRASIRNLALIIAPGACGARRLGSATAHREMTER